MSRQINPGNRYSASQPCPHDGTFQRYRNSNECCECKKRWQQQEAGAIHRGTPHHNIDDQPKMRPVIDPTIGSAFADSIRDRLRAGR